MYKLFNDPIFNTLKYIIRISDGANIPLNSDNTDYAHFKREIAAGTAELQDADGQPMSVADANAYVAALP